MRAEDVAEVAPGVFHARGDLVDRYLLRDGDDLTLVDAGYPGDVRAVLVTHAHADHLGAVAALHAGGGALDLPGAPVPVATPGHTCGHTAFHLPELGVVITGDALVTGHPTSRLRGPQLLPAMFDHDRAWAREALAVLGALDADVVLPGHGEPARGPVAAVVEQALAQR